MLPPEALVRVGVARVPPRRVVVRALPLVMGVWKTIAPAGETERFPICATEAEETKRDAPGALASSPVFVSGPLRTRFPLAARIVPAFLMVGMTSPRPVSVAVALKSIAPLPASVVAWSVIEAEVVSDALRIDVEPLA